jgi:dihydropteroate synthase
MTVEVSVAFSFADVAAGSLMGVLNITPDSFSDGGAFLGVEAAVARGRALVAAGARVLEVGAEASSFFREGVGAVEGGVLVER